MVDSQARCATQLLNESGIVEQSGPVNDDCDYLIVLHQRGNAARFGRGLRLLTSYGINPAALEGVEEFERRVVQGGGDQLATSGHRCACHLDDESGEPAADPSRRESL